MYYKKLYYEALSSTEFKEKVSDILIGMTNYTGDDKLDIIAYNYRSFCEAAVEFDYDEEKEAYCTIIKQRLYKMLEKETKKEKRRIKK